MSNIQMRVVAVLAVFLTSTFLTTDAVAAPDVFGNVPEASEDGYVLVYSLPIEDQAGYSTPRSVPWSVDNSATVTGPFDRIAYYLELDSGSGLEFAYVSMDAFTSNITEIGLPIASNGASFQQIVSNMNVVSNSGRVTNGTGLATGNIEFWPNNYGVANQINIPGASDDNFDVGDTRSGGGNYGSFQIHNHGAGQTILAYNQWGGFNATADGDLGIGNSPNPATSDWTFSGNTSNYTVKSLQILVRPSALSIYSGLQRAVFQRNEHNRASVPVSGQVTAGVTSIEARALPRPGSSGVPTDWTVIATAPITGSYSGTLNLFGGWYDIEVRSLTGAKIVDQTIIERVGAGEVFIVAGQSNSANFGSTLLTPLDDRVSSFNLTNWRLAIDPQPIANGLGGSPWPALGDAMAMEQDVPIGFITVGWGGTSVLQWVPGAAGPDIEPLYERLQAALQSVGPGGARAVLWHQGETDNALGLTTANYRQALESVIAQSRIDAGFDIPWGIAQASFVPNSNPQTSQAIIDAQAQVAANDPSNFVGALTDDLTGPAWRAPDLIHFNEAGLREHAARWHAAINGFFQQPGVPVGPDASKLLDGEGVGGQLSDVIHSDDIDWLLDPSPTTNPFKQKIDVLLVAETTNLAPSSFAFCLEGSMSGGPAGDVIQTVRLWNFADVTWDVLDIRAAPASEEQILVDATGDLTDYVNQANGELIARISWESPEFAGLPFNWSIALDQAIWLVGD